jgi:hypothetical protein
MKRSFKVIYKNSNDSVIIDGNYCAPTPKQAAFKALTGIHKEYKKNGKNTENIKFGLIETTKNRICKTYVFAGEKIELKCPIDLYKVNDKYITKTEVNNIGGFLEVFKKDENDVKSSISYKYANNIKRINKSECNELFDELKKYYDNFENSKITKMSCENFVDKFVIDAHMEIDI